MTDHIPPPSTASNPAVDDDAAAANLCGQTHLPTGRTCLLAARHSGSCDFHPPGESAGI